MGENICEKECKIDIHGSSSCGEGRVSWEFSSYGRINWFILEERKEVIERGQWRVKLSEIGEFFSMEEGECNSWTCEHN